MTPHQNCLLQERLESRKSVLEKEREELIEYMKTLPLSANATEEHTRLRNKVVEIMWIRSVLEGHISDRGITL